ncbi:MAG: cation diffusion facilitator family transporter [Solirubrobacterales bacterium]|nr:cation diffusion facilitator family transporter [Solirubrobacterales bacterium]
MGAPAQAQEGTPLRTALVSVIAAAVLVAIKLVAGLITGSLGLVAESVHSGTDLVAALLTFLALRVAIRPPDREHPYGHGKAEHLAALGEASFLVLASLFIASQSVIRLSEGGEGHVDAAWWAIALLGVVAAIDVSRTVVSYRASKRFHSAALRSNALHFGSDLLGTTAVLAGLLLVRAGVEEADAIAALVVAGLVILAAARLMRENVHVLMDRTSEEAESAARGAIEAAEPGVEVRRLRVRHAAGTHFVDAVVGVPPDSALGEGHAIADSIEDAICAALPGGDVVVHVEPGTPEGDLRERASAAALAVRGIREVHNVRVLEVGGRRELSLHLKLPADLDLQAAHELTTSVERAIRAAVPELRDVHTHIEPLATAGEARAIRRVVRDLTGAEPERLRFRTDERGLVALLTVGLAGEQRLEDAHTAASELERRIREAAPAVAEVIVHTEPR